MTEPELSAECVGHPCPVHGYYCPTQSAESVAPSTLAQAILRMTKREKEAFALGVLAASPSIPDSTITKMALARIDGTPDA